MSYIHLSGVMLTPVNTPASNVPLRITSEITYGQVVKHAEAVYTCGEDGSYDLDLMYGFYSIEAKFEDSYEFVGATYVDSSYPTQVTLNDLFGHTVIPSHPNLEEMREIEAEVQQDAQDAAQSAADAAASATSAQNSADSASTSAVTCQAAVDASSQSANFASGSQIAAQNSAVAANADSASASTSATNAAASAQTASDAANSILNAQISTGQDAATSNQNATNAQDYADLAAASASAALASEQLASGYADNALSSAESANDSMFSASSSAAAAAESEENADIAASTATSASTTAVLSANSAVVSAGTSTDNAAITTQNAASCASDASTSGTNATQAAQAAINASNSQTIATSAANNASSDAAQCSDDRNDAVNAANQAVAAKNLAEQYAEALSTGVVAMGPWSASSGYFPPIPNPSDIVEAYRITNTGTLRVGGPSGQPNISVVASDLIYWAPSQYEWYRVRMADQVTGPYILSELLPIDGAGSGLDADKLDGYHGSSYAKLGSYQTWTSQQYFRYGATGIDYSQIDGAPSAVTNNNQISNGRGYITGISKSMVTNALGYTPYKPNTALSATTGSFSSGITGASLTVSGNIGASGNITAYSDYRIKANLQVIPDALDKVITLTGYTFDRTDVEMPRQVGLLAQDVREVLPEAVEEDSEGKLSVAYGNITALLVEAVKELQAKVIELENKKSV